MKKVADSYPTFGELIGWRDKVTGPPDAFTATPGSRTRFSSLWDARANHGHRDLDLAAQIFSYLNFNYFTYYTYLFILN